MPSNDIRDISGNAAAISRQYASEERGYWEEPLSELLLARTQGAWIHRCRIQFRAEPAAAYVSRLEAAYNRQQRAEMLLQLQLSTESMPQDGLRGLPQEMARRIEEKCTGVKLDLPQDCSLVERLQEERNKRIRARSRPGTNSRLRSKRGSIMDGSFVSHVSSISSNTEQGAQLKRSLGAQVAVMLRAELMEEVRVIIC